MLHWPGGAEVDERHHRFMRWFHGTARREADVEAKKRSNGTDENVAGRFSMLKG